LPRSAFIVSACAMGACVCLRVKNRNNDRGQREKKSAKSLRLTANNARKWWKRNSAVPKPSAYCDLPPWACVSIYGVLADLVLVHGKDVQPDPPPGPRVVCRGADQVSKRVLPAVAHEAVRGAHHRSRCDSSRCRSCGRSCCRVGCRVGSRAQPLGLSLRCFGRRRGRHFRRG
jgi:hypothetical protein